MPKEAVISFPHFNMDHGEISPNRQIAESPKSVKSSNSERNRANGTVKVKEGIVNTVDEIKGHCGQNNTEICAINGILAAVQELIPELVKDILPGTITRTVVDELALTSMLLEQQSMKAMKKFITNRKDKRKHIVRKLFMSDDDYQTILGFDYEKLSSVKKEKSSKNALKILQSEIDGICSELNINIEDKNKWLFEEYEPVFIIAAYNDQDGKTAEEYLKWERGDIITWQLKQKEELMLTSKTQFNEQKEAYNSTYVEEHNIKFPPTDMDEQYGEYYTGLTAATDDIKTTYDQANRECTELKSELNSLIDTMKEDFATLQKKVIKLNKMSADYELSSTPSKKRKTSTTPTASAPMEYKVTNGAVLKPLGDPYKGTMAQVPKYPKLK